MSLSLKFADKIVHGGAQDSGHPVLGKEEAVVAALDGDQFVAHPGVRERASQQLALGQRDEAVAVAMDQQERGRPGGDIAQRAGGREQVGIDGAAGRTRVLTG